MLSGFDGFHCKPYWRLFPVDGTKENAYDWKGTRYVVRKEYDVRFYCTWSMKDSVATQFNITYHGQKKNWTSYNLGPLPLYAIPGGYVVPLPKAFFQVQTEGNVTISVGNALFQERFMVEIAAASSILNVEPHNASDIVLWKSQYDFMVSYESLGLPSCALVEMTSEKIRYVQEIGAFGDASQCLKYFRGNFFLLILNVLIMIGEQISIYFKI